MVGNVLALVTLLRTCSFDAESIGVASDCLAVNSHPKHKHYLGHLKIRKPILDFGTTFCMPMESMQRLVFVFLF